MMQAMLKIFKLYACLKIYDYVLMSLISLYLSYHSPTGCDEKYIISPKAKTLHLNHL